MNKKLLFLSLGIIGLASIILLQNIPLNFAFGIGHDPGAPDDRRTFQLSKQLINTINDATYTNGDPVSASSENIPQIVIERWSQVSIISQAAILAKANSDGWSDITCIVNVCS